MGVFRIGARLGIVACLGPLLALGCAPSADRPNVVMIVLDTVRADYTGLAGADRSATPTLDAIAAEGTRFDRAWSAAPWTVPSHASLFTGRLPSRHRCSMANLRFDDSGPSLAELVADVGYETAAMFANPWLGDDMAGLLRGFEIREESPVSGFMGRPLDRRGYQGGPAVVEQIGSWLDRRSRDRPFFLFVNFLEPHLPYDPPPEQWGELLSDLRPDDAITVDWGHGYNAGLYDSDTVDWERVRRLYAADVRNVDSLLFRVVELLKRHGVYEDSVLIVTSDHGENLGDHGRMDHQFSVHETLLHVPLVVRAPGYLPPGVRREPVMLTDLFATVLEVAGVERETLPIHSRSLRNRRPELGFVRPILAEYSGPHSTLIELLSSMNPELDTDSIDDALRTVRVGPLRLTIASDGTQVLHDLSSDPSQTIDLAGARPGQLRDLLPHLRLDGPAFRPAAEDVGRPEMDQERLEQLRSLGYLN